jgi:hypothetical protein
MKKRQKRAAERDTLWQLIGMIYAVAEASQSGSKAKLKEAIAEAYESANDIADEYPPTKKMDREADAFLTPKDIFQIDASKL